MNKPIDPVKMANRLANDVFTAMPKLHKDAFTSSAPHAEGFEKCAEPGCQADGFPGSGKCWEHTPSDGKAVFTEQMTREEFAKKYPESHQNESPLARELREHVCSADCRHYKP